MELTPAEIWTRVLEAARSGMPEQSYRTWLSGTRAVALAGDRILVETPSDFHTEWVEDKFGPGLAELAGKVLGHPVGLEFRTAPDGARPHVPGTPGGSADGGTRHPPLPDGASVGEAPDVRVAPMRPDPIPGVRPAPPPGGARPAPEFRPEFRGGAPSPSEAGSAPRGPGGSGGVGWRGEDRPTRPGPGSPGSGLNDRYTFDRFVVGTHNQLAAAASRAVAETPARIYNPLFIYGGVGLGKTHLMHAVGHEILVRHPERRVAYVSAERFMNELVTAIQTGTTGAFRRHYRQIDLLLVDDVHFLVRKESTQEEFFHTFNTLYDAGRQIILTSDRAPKDLPGVEERLVSRFEWGLVVDIKPPDYETRVAILRKKADDDGLALDDPVIDFIARSCTSSVRELEGAVIKLLAYSSLKREEVTESLARAALSGMLRTDQGGGGGPGRLTPAGIRDRVARAWGVSPQGLESRKRTRDLTVPRQVAMYLIKELLDESLVGIGRVFGGRDHSTVIHSIRKVEEELTSDPEFAERVRELRAEFEGGG
jgi:chromosomal replication initiator protein